MNQDEMKLQVAKEALKYVIPNTIIGVGTGSTANFFIDELASIKDKIIATVASSDSTRDRLKSHNIKVLDLNEVGNISVYIDGADEINDKLHMIKGGGGALTREKIVAAVADKFICIADSTKLVDTMGKFPLPVEVIPMSVNYVVKEIEKLTTGKAKLRQGFITDNQNVILDITGLTINDAPSLETKLNSIVGIVSNGLFANRGANVLLLGTKNGVITKQ